LEKFLLIAKFNWGAEELRKGLRNLRTEEFVVWDINREKLDFPLDWRRPI